MFDECKEKNKLPHSRYSVITTQNDEGRDCHTREGINVSSSRVPVGSPLQDLCFWGKVVREFGTR